ncbi:hypothetical protein AOQ84DRAFT_59827 [Glonium stellatum]|uniref:Uncharacterized protein n=1 Tax=Glonium stellatum TaxID=574774 RepID=A0A8E2JS08_9PEZI|nr:hypothetical protein AOQ84DRAFT_59827 [Glonium stellatum]
MLRSKALFAILNLDVWPADAVPKMISQGPTFSCRCCPALQQHARKSTQFYFEPHRVAKVCTVNRRCKALMEQALDGYSSKLSEHRLGRSPEWPSTTLRMLPRRRRRVSGNGPSTIHAINQGPLTP